VPVDCQRAFPRFCSQCARGTEDSERVPAATGVNDAVGFAAREPDGDDAPSLTSQALGVLGRIPGDPAVQWGEGG